MRALVVLCVFFLVSTLSSVSSTRVNVHVRVGEGTLIDHNSVHNYLVNDLNKETSSSSALSSDNAQSHFTAWMKKFHKKYTFGELADRFAIWLDNFLHVKFLNSLDQAWTAALHEDADFTTEEFRKLRMGATPHQSAEADIAIAADTSNSTTLPFGRDSSGAAFPIGYGATFDWRTHAGVLAPVQDQGQCGACVQFASTATIESAYAILHNIPVVKLSEEQLLDCTKGIVYEGIKGKGCDGSLGPLTYAYLMGRAGSTFNGSRPIYTDDSYPYRDGRNECHMAKDSKVRLRSYETLGSDNVKDAVETLMAAVTQGPVSVVVNGDSLRYYNSGVLDNSDGCSTEKVTDYNHNLVLVGWGTKDERRGFLWTRRTVTYDYWILRNSWGSSYGEDGYLRVIRGGNICGLELSPFVYRPVVE